MIKTYIQKLQEEIVEYRSCGFKWRTISFMVHKTIYFTKKVSKMTEEQKTLFCKKNGNGKQRNTKNRRDSLARYIRERRHNDPQYKVAHNLRKRLSMSLKSKKTYKSNKTLVYIGCSKEQLKIHIEGLFNNGMSWDNYGKWHIDHIKPISLFDLSKEEEIYKAMHYTNLQPLWAIDNIKKNNSYTHTSLTKSLQSVTI